MTEEELLKLPPVEAAAFLETVKSSWEREDLRHVYNQRLKPRRPGRQIPTREPGAPQDRSGWRVMSWVLIGAGSCLLIWAVFYPVSVRVSLEESVVNTGKLADRLSVLLAGLSAMLGGLFCAGVHSLRSALVEGSRAGEGA